MSKMAPRKSNISIVSTTGDDRADSTPVRAAKEKEPKNDGLSVEASRTIFLPAVNTKKYTSANKQQDISLPKSMIARLAKGVLPANTQIQKDALLALHKSAPVFVSYVASNANENAQSAGKKTIAPHDVVAALKDAEFEAFIPRLQAELEKYSSTQNNKRNTYRKKVKEEKTVAVAPEGGEGDSAVSGTGDVKEATGNGHADDDSERPFKKFKAKNGAAIDPDAEVDDGDRDSEAEQDDDDDEEVEDEVVDEEGSDDDDQGSGEGEDETMEETVDELEAQAGIRDEALDQPDSD